MYYLLLLLLTIVFSAEAKEYTYTPSESVRAAHRIPHLTQNFGPISDSSFNLTSFTKNPTNAVSYFGSLVPLPALLTIAGVLSLLIYAICICCRRCCRCCKNAPSEDDIIDYPDKVIKNRRIVLGFFLFFLLVVLLADFALFFGNADIDSGVQKGGDALDGLYNIFSTLDVSGQALYTDGTAILTTINADTTQCPVSQLTSSVTSFNSAMNTINGIVHPIAPYFQTYKSYLQEYGFHIKNIVGYSFFAVIATVIFILAIAVFFQSKFIIMILLLLSWFIVLALTLVCGVVMIVVTLLADFCMDPAGNIKQIVNSADFKNIVTYYSSCVGTGPLDSSYTSAENAFATLQTTLTSLKTNIVPCQTDDAITTIQAYVTDMQNQLASVGTQISCDPLATVWDQAVNQGLCTYAVGGIYKIWVSEYVTSGGLFLTMIMASVVYQYFGPAWSLRSLKPTGAKPTKPVATDGHDPAGTLELGGAGTLELGELSASPRAGGYFGVGVGPGGGTSAGMSPAEAYRQGQAKADQYEFNEDYDPSSPSGAQNLKQDWDKAATVFAAGSGPGAGSGSGSGSGSGAGFGRGPSAPPAPSNTTGSGRQYDQLPTGVVIAAYSPSAPPQPRPPPIVQGTVVSRDEIPPQLTRY